MIFDSVQFFFLKNNQTKFFFKKTKTSSIQPVSVRFGFFEKKPVQTGLARFWLDFFRFGFGSVRFFRFQAYKTETEPISFFKILIGLIDFFHGSIISVIVFPVFSV